MHLDMITTACRRFKGCAIDNKFSHLGSQIDEYKRKNYLVGEQSVLKFVFQWWKNVGLGKQFDDEKKGKNHTHNDAIMT